MIKQRDIPRNTANKKLNCLIESLPILKDSEIKFEINCHSCGKLGHFAKKQEETNRLNAERNKYSKRDEVIKSWEIDLV